MKKIFLLMCLLVLVALGARGEIGEQEFASSTLMAAKNRYIDAVKAADSLRDRALSKARKDVYGQIAKHLKCIPQDKNA